MSNIKGRAIWSSSGQLLEVIWYERTRDIDLSGANLCGADLRGADLSDANLIGAYLSDANLIGAYLRGANLRGANLSDANLSGANLIGANLRGANLSGAYLSGAYLSGAYLCGADLRGAYLCGADLRGAYLRGATVIDAGQDSRGYLFVANQQEKGYRIAAGCRWFTQQEADAHWAGNGEAMIKVGAIEAEARRREW